MQPYSILRPDSAPNGILFNSPHSGTYLPESLLKQISVAPSLLHYSGDILVDQLIVNAPLFGATCFFNNFARAYVDTNRSAFEIDAEMFRNPGRKGIFEQTEKVARGFGVLSRKTYNGKDIYRDKLPATEIGRRLKQAYHPVHKALSDLLSTFHQRCGYYILIDCHSMPSYQFIDASLTNARQPDLIIGTCYDSSCGKKLSRHIADYFISNGLHVVFDVPYAGGFNTQQYGKPLDYGQALQLEFNRASYMDEETLTRNEGFSTLQGLLTDLSKSLNDNLKSLVQANRP